MSDDMALLLFFVFMATILAPLMRVIAKRNAKAIKNQIEGSRYIEVTDADLQHEHDRSVKEATEYKQWLEEKRKEEARRRLDEIVRQAEKMAQECAEETERMNNPDKHPEKLLKPSIYLFPIMLAVASLFDMPSWFYTLFKIVVLFEAIILIGIRLNDGKFRSDKVAAGSVYMAFMGAIGILSFTNGGFPRSFWALLDIGYCIMHILIYMGFIKGGSNSN